MSHRPFHHIGKRDWTTNIPAAPAPNINNLPEEMLQDAARRLGMAGISYSIVYALAFYGPGITTWIRTGAIPSQFVDPLPMLLSNFFILLGVLVWLAVKLPKMQPRKMLDLGLLFQVLSTLGIGLPSLWGIFPEFDPEALESGVFGIPWECAWIIAYPVIVPNTPWKSLIASLLSAAMPALVLTLSKFFGPTDPELPLGFFYIYYLFSTFICAFLAAFTSRILLRYGNRLRRAQEMGRYKLTRIIGRGGMGEVWEAEHRMLARTVAVKLIRPDALSGDQSARHGQLRRFEREARATAALHSVHSIGVYDFGLTPEGNFYYVMELLEGLDLESYVKRFGPVSPDRAIHLLRQSCHALMDAHGCGLIHRDLKPANLYLCRLGPDCDFVKVLDYGLVKDSGNDNAGATQLTQDGISFGTPGYMAPEVAMSAGKADAPSDIYALGCIAYFLLTGIQVFEGDTALATVLMHLKDEPVPPSRCSELPLSEDLESIIMDCLAKSPADRPASAEALDARLAACAEAGAWGNAEARDWWNLHLPADPAHGLSPAAGPTEAGI